MSAGVPDFTPPPDVRHIADLLEENGFEAWAVGGALRDSLLGAGQPDWDLATSARPAQVRALFRRTVPIGIEHGTVGVLLPGGPLIEVTTFRLDVETDGRHAVVEFADDIEDDLARRDFTMNAMAWRPATGEFRDPFGGQADLEAGVLRAVGDPAARFAEDRLRVLRALRFAGCLRLEIEPGTWRALRSAAPDLGRLSAERVREELMKVMVTDRPSAALRGYAEAGALAAWYPEMDRASRDPGWEVRLAAVDALPASRLLLRVAEWLLALGTDEDSRVRESEETLARLKFSNADSARVTHLVRHSPPLVSVTDSSASLRAWLAEVGERSARDLFRLQFAMARARGAGETERMLVHTWRRIHDELLAGPPLRLSELAVAGADLLELGVAEGPAIGLLLDELHAEVLEDPGLNERAALLARARELIRIGGLGAPGDAPDGAPAGPPGEA
ncbi:MAG: CCA tRNA nucleotidyltransferase [Gemmatimonadota bacterium]